MHKEKSNDQCYTYEIFHLKKGFIPNIKKIKTPNQEKKLLPKIISIKLFSSNLYYIHKIGERKKIHYQ